MWSRREPFEGHDTEGRSDGNKSAPSWQDYLDALRLEGARYKPASLRKALEDRERAGGNPRTSEKEMK
jgi:hypothetical protein